MHLEKVKLATFKDSQLLFDPTKLIITIDGLTGSEVWDVLLEKYGILVEKVTKKAIVITIHSHTSDEDASALIAALQDIDSQVD